jgi:penicillin-binding protein 2
MAIDWQDEFIKIRLLTLVMISVLIVLLAMLWRIQVSRGEGYRESLARQSLRRIRIPAQRGRILDRNGVCLADNRPGYNVALYLEEIRRKGSTIQTLQYALALIDEMSDLLGRPAEISESDLRSHMRRRLPLPLILWQDLDAADIARLAEQGERFPGTELVVEPIRHYPQGSLAAHLLGQVGRAGDSGDEDREYHYTLRDTEGKRGLELTCNRWLSGTPGEQVVRIDVAGFRHEENAAHAPVPGADVTLSLDVRIQRLAEQALANETGAVVVLDVRSGDVLGLASEPGYDPNIFVPAISDGDWKALLADPGRPLINRAVSEIYAAGSIFKPVVALAALASGRTRAETVHACPGYFQLGSVRFHCWNANGHGSIGLRKAIEQSCNVYFCAMGMQCGYPPIVALARDLGFGARTGIDLDVEAEGLVPDDEWKRKAWHDGWRSGDTCNLSIGQGALSVTPLQVAVMTAALANGGTVFRPRLIREVRNREGGLIQRYDGERIRSVDLKPEHLAAVRRGMHDVVEAPEGTAHRARIEAVEMAGKTGTAEYGQKGAGRKHVWMILYAPYDQPKYAVAMVLDDGVSGGQTVAPRMRALMNSLFGGEASNG